MSEFTPSPDDSTDDLTWTDILQRAADLSVIGHAMACYLLNSDTAFEAFCLAYQIERAKMPEMRASITKAHSTFVNLSARAERDLFLAMLTDSLSALTTPADDTPAASS